jgi:cystathionine gamma-synthase
MSKEKSRKTLATRSVRAGLESDAQHGSVVPPIYLSSNFAFEAYRKPRKYDYSRSGNPTRDQLAVALTDLEGGAGGVVTCTGLAAITLVLATLPQGARVLAPHDCYGGTYRLLAALHAQGKLVTDFVDQSDAAALSAALASRPELVWIETPSNPLVRVVDIHAIAQAAHAAGALVAADNTFLSPLWQQPLALGADLVVHSTT